MSTDDQPAGPGARKGADPAAERRQGDGTTLHIGHQSGGSIATGDHGVAHSTNFSGTGLDPAVQKLLGAIVELRARLPQDRSAEDDALDAELSAVEGEITRSGRADRSLLARALARLAAYGPAAATTASVTAVIQALAPLLG